MKLYDLELSGNCYKVRLFCALLDLPLTLEPVDTRNGEHKQPAFLALNPLGQIPVLVDGEVVLRDSQAILVYLARKTERSDWLPLEAGPLATVMQWLSTAANELARGPADARAGVKFGRQLDVELARAKAFSILGIIDTHLGRQRWLACDRPTIADIACFPYIALAPEGGIGLEPYSNIKGWMNRIASLPGYISMPGIA